MKAAGRLDDAPEPYRKMNAVLDAERFAATRSVYDLPPPSFDADMTQVERGTPPGEPELHNGKAWKALMAEEQRVPGDFETQVGQGPSTLHSEEHLVSSDKGVVLLRRQLKAAAQDVAEGRDPLLTFGQTKSSSRQEPT